MKTKFYYSSRFWIYLYAFVVLTIMSIQFIFGLLKNDNIYFLNKTINNFINDNLNLPMETLSWCWTAIVSIYCGSDRIVDIAKTTKLSVGQTSLGDLSKLRKIIMLSLLLFIIAVCFNLFTDKDYTLSAYASAFGMTIISYAVGNKAVKASAYFGKHDDVNNDGIPDVAENAYNKWKRQQIKNGVDSIYLTFDYFLDDPANKEWEDKLRPDSSSTMIEEKKPEKVEENEHILVPFYPIYKPVDTKSKKGLLKKAKELSEKEEN